MSLTNKERIIVALDVSMRDELRTLIQELYPYVGGFKIGLEALYSLGPHILRDLSNMLASPPPKIFCDAKLSDIPNTVGAAAKIISDYGVWALNVHANAGPASVKAAVDNSGKALVFAVTVLTSITADDCYAIYRCFPETAVRNMALQAQDAGAHGIICSPKELPQLARLPLLKMVPGVRPAWASVNDQARVMTPTEAVKAGADFLVIGRPILKPPSGNPVEAAQAILEELEGVTCEA